MSEVLVIKTTALLPKDTLKHLQTTFAEQVKTGVVIIPPYFDAEIINCPDDVEVVVQSGSVEESTFLNKEFNVKKEKQNDQA